MIKAIFIIIIFCLALFFTYIASPLLVFGFFVVMAVLGAIVKSKGA